ncbi:hypothetical protein [Roseofilum sp. Belize Diploria]|uniref:hypothetical protein n=1 Tax=Roseofilum sp. Belize Diploria TaxID=2821501 RepID=UPI001B0BB391|nr:hypothetical protein [Roseofilum sp. Belize Diploria]MBP0008079.1 hypothetical protein [Roseofilum sp. Belize Diploria]
MGYRICRRYQVSYRFKGVPRSGVVKARDPGEAIAKVESYIKSMGGTRSDVNSLKILAPFGG